MLKLMEAEMKRNEGTTCIQSLLGSFETIENEYDRRWEAIKLVRDDEDDCEVYENRVEEEHDKLANEHFIAITRFVEFGGRKMYQLRQENHYPLDSKTAYTIWQVDRITVPYYPNAHEFAELLRRYYDHLTNIDTESDPWK